MDFGIILSNTAQALFSPATMGFALAALGLAVHFGFAGLLNFGIAGFMVYLIYVAEGNSKTSHYALATGFMALGMMLPGLISGFMQEWLGYDGFFVWVVIAALPAFILLKYIKYPPNFGKEVCLTAGIEHAT